MTVGNLVRDARNLPAVPLKEVTNYRNTSDELTRHVNEYLASQPDINVLIGHNPFQVMYDNHRNHSAFMTTVFSVGNYELLARIVVWAYHAYHAHGFSYDYFPRAMNAWISAIDEQLYDTNMETVKSIYQWIIDHHDDLKALSKETLFNSPPVDQSFLALKNTFLQALLDGDHVTCLKIGKDHIVDGDDIYRFYLHVVQPSMYEIGMMWENGAISVAQEHLASSIVGRVLAVINVEQYSPPAEHHKAIVTASPNEYHEIGAWMVSDVLRLDGWNVRYLGANTPPVDLLVMAKTFNPDIIAISVTMPFNLDHTSDIIGKIKGKMELESTKVIVGGRTFNEFTGLWKTVGADGHTFSIDGVASLARNLVRAS